MDYKIWLAILAIAISLISYANYYWGISRGRIKPHAFSWFIWGLLTGIGAVFMFLSGAGTGSWELATSFVFCMGISIIGLRQGHVIYSKFDWLSLTGAIFAIILWVSAKNPLSAIILLSISDGIGFLPSFRKAFYHPHEESAGTFTLSGIKYIPTIFAIQNFNLTTVIYPFFLLICNLSFALMIFIRRRQIKI